MENMPHGVWGWEDLMKKPTKKDWLIYEVLAAKSRALVYADSGVGKTFTLLDMALHIATGLPWQGRAVKQGPVYYLAAENAELFSERMQAWEKEHRGGARWMRAHPGEPVPIYVFYDGVDLSSDAAMEATLAKLGPAQLVVIDTVMASMGGLDIKDPHQIALALTQGRHIMETTGGAVLFVTHTPEGGQGPIGGSAWRGGTQTRMYLTRQRPGIKGNVGEDAHFQDRDTITLACKKQSGAPQFSDIVIPVRLVKPPHADLSVPVLVSQKGRGRSQSGSPAPKLRMVPSEGWPAFYAAHGWNVNEVARLTNRAPAAVRKDMQRKGRPVTEEMCEDVPA